MKKYQIIGLFALALNCSYGQYGDRTYPHNNTYLQSGKTVDINSTGFVMGSILPGASGTGWDLIVEKTDVNGLFTNPAVDFSENFHIQSDPNCGAPSFKHNFTGIDVIEVSSGGNERYAVVAVSKDGVFFFTLDAAGLLTNNNITYWPITNAQFGKPAIVQSGGAGGDVYICGSFNSDSYVMRVGLNGVPVWSDHLSGFLIQANDLVESANGNDLIVVGRCQHQTIPAFDGFFLKLNAGLGTYAAGNFIAYSDGITGDEWFNTIEHASDVNGTGIGYIVGGWMSSQQAIYNGYKTWVVKLDVNGNFIFNTLINHYSEVYDVIERYNGVTAPNPYEYFAIGREYPGAGVNDLIVWKLDQNGNSGSYFPEVWTYNIGITAAGDMSYANLEKIGDGTGAADGFAAFATDVSNFDNILIKAYYNGVNGCSSDGSMITINGPTSTAGPNPNVSSLQYCNALIYQQSNNYTPGSNCGWGTPTGGSNARPSGITGLKTQSSVTGMVSVYPNPSNGVFTVEVGNHSAVAQIRITNSMGQLVKEFEMPSEIQKTLVNFQELNLSEGLYLIDITINNQTQTKKVAYQK